MKLINQNEEERRMTIFENAYEKNLNNLENEEEQVEKCENGE